MDKVIEQTVLKPVTAKKSTIANDLELHQADNMIVIENEKLSELSTFIKEQFSLPTTPATSWEEVEKEFEKYWEEKSIKDWGEMGVFHQKQYLYNRELYKSKERDAMWVFYMKRHVTPYPLPSSQPVSPTPMAETWEEIRGMLSKKSFHEVDTLVSCITVDDALEVIKSLSAPSLHQVDRWVRVEDGPPKKHENAYTT